MKMSLYVEGNGHQLKRYGLIIKIHNKYGKLLQEVPSIYLEQIVLIGNIQVSSSVLDLCYKKNISIVSLTQTGEYKYFLTPFNYRLVELRMAQYEKVKDEKFSLEMAKKIVEAKIKSQKVFLQRYGRKGILSFTRNLVQLDLMLNGVSKALSKDELLGIEGNASRVYFQSFSRILNSDWEFKKRIRRPPTDPVNVLLSFAYTLLFKKVLSQIYIAGLDPYLGFFHQLRDRRESLALDIMEEFRVPVVDSLVISLLNKGIFKKDYFYHEDRKLLLKKEGIGLLLKSFQDRLTSRIKYQGKSLSYEQLIKSQVSNLKKTIAVDGEYKPFSWR